MCGQNALYTLFPNLYLLDRRQNAFVAENFHLLGGVVVWNLCLRRNLIDREISDLTSLLGMLDTVYISVGKSDSRIWKPDVKGKFSVKSFL